MWKNEIENNKNIKYYGAIEDGKVVATCYTVIIPNLTAKSRPICFVENVVTDMNHRKQGLARKVLEKAVETAITVEEVAKMAYLTLMLNPEADTVSKTLLEKHYYRKHGKNAYYGQ